MVYHNSPRFVANAENMGRLLYSFNREVVIVNRISELRRGKGWTQVDLASMLNVKRQTVGNYETGIREIDAPTICRLCDVFGCTADYLLGRSILPAAELTEEEAAILLAWRVAPDNIRAGIRALLAPSSEAAVAR